ncbi:MAG: DUF2796 domain-containing protein [Aquimonas sp.]|nr:DUF2796 domain-containing protein [Aquimonas sp.]
MQTHAALRTAALPALLLSALALALPAPAHAHGRHDHAQDEKHKDSHGHDHASEDEQRSHGAHVHGQSQLDIAVVGGVIELQLDGAAYNFIGFERAPASPEEEARVAAARALLAEGDSLYALPSQAGCRALDQRLSAPLPEAKAAHDGHDHDQKHDHDHDHGHDHDHDHNHDHDHAQSAHANWQAYHRFECTRPEALDGLQVRVFEHFPGTTRIDYQLVSERAQSGGRLSAGEDRVSLR